MNLFRIPLSRGNWAWSQLVWTLMFLMIKTSYMPASCLQTPLEWKMTIITRSRIYTASTAPRNFGIIHGFLAFSKWLSPPVSLLITSYLPRSPVTLYVPSANTQKNIPLVRLTYIPPLSTLPAMNTPPSCGRSI